MRILYIAKHNSGGNDDEGAIAHALTVLGHEVILRHERGLEPLPNGGYDAVLCHGCHNFNLLRRAAREVPLAFWYFDRVVDTDPTLTQRNEARRYWAQCMAEIADVGFVTDGDWASRNGKLHWLPQGADERVVGRGSPLGGGHPPILLAASAAKGCGADRMMAVEKILGTWGSKVRHVQRGFHGRDMANLVASAKIVLAPSAPCSHNYWSNRIFQMAGFGACVLHPLSYGLSRYYTASGAYIAYTEDMVELVENTLADDAARTYIQETALRETMDRNLYRHRCEYLVGVLARTQKQGG